MPTEEIGPAPCPSPYAFSMFFLVLCGFFLFFLKKGCQKRLGGEGGLFVIFIFQKKTAKANCRDV